MQELSKSQKARHAIRTFKILADSISLQGSYRPSGQVGEKLAEALKQLSPEIYGSMTDGRIIELKGLEYVIDRMPKGIENCTRIILTAQEDFQETSFAKIVPFKRRRVSYAVSDKELCFVITTGKSEIYDILTHITFLNIEAQKIYQQARKRVDGISSEWAELQRIVAIDTTLEDEVLEQAIWNLSIILGRTYKETRDTYDYLEKNRQEKDSNSGLFKIVYGIGQRVMAEHLEEKNELTVYFTPSLHEMMDNQKYASLWAEKLKDSLCRLNCQDRPIHVVIANMHSMRNLLFGPKVLEEAGEVIPDDLYEMVRAIRDRGIVVDVFTRERGFTYQQDSSGSNIDINIIDLAAIEERYIHPALKMNVHLIKEAQPVLLVIDYAFGTQAFDVMDELLRPFRRNGDEGALSIKSISIMGKAGVLPGKKGDIMLATAHVIEGTGDNYIVNNDLQATDFHDSVRVYTGPMVTVLGTSLQNRDVLERFHSSSWRAVGLEMEGGHYQRAISGAIIQGFIPADMKTRYAYYASDNPMVSGQTLASGPMGDEGILSTYMISKVILEKITNYDDAEKS
ncbi:hypothetical protein FCL47_11740 [Desulfopila sp. IMCC35006]|uniref:DUF6909 family protein n=1 Tax=Desulfopila sp. IMCC35006 TaxID=2569542 RepID=UPI0010AD7103|nr:hypothetical protein [Desulfopila sp. IMCC35006]TKB25774.1 hypothetical protein FCL47_11740 [Desulfopila sp. IMCC35006]